MQEKEYWNGRGRLSYKYRGEEFYTITPVPYYYARRKQILDLLYRICKIEDFKSICDYGCGDGMYLHYLRSKGIQGKMTGIDISKEMINKAEQHCKGDHDISFYVSKGIGIERDEKYDCIYSVALFAHIDDELVKKYFLDIASHLEKDGYFIFCEQVGKVRVQGNGYNRRTVDEYRNELKKCGFETLEIKVIDFWLHRLIFERRLAKRFYAGIKADSQSEQRIAANHMKCFRLCSLLFTLLSKPCIFPYKIGGGGNWGYSFFVCKLK